MASSWTSSGKWSTLGSGNDYTGYSNDAFKGATGIGKTDWGSMDDWGGGFGVDKEGKFGSGPKPFGGGSKTDLLKAAGVFGSLLSKAGGQDKYRDQMEFGPRVLGEGFGGRAGQVLENLGVVFPQQAAPLYIPGVQEGKSTGQRIAGGLGGALQGAATGAAFGPIGAVAGGLIGGFGGAFG